MSRNVKRIFSWNINGIRSIADKDLIQRAPKTASFKGTPGREISLPTDPRGEIRPAWGSLSKGKRVLAKVGFLEWLKTVSPDILCLQETKAHPEDLAPRLFLPEGYHTFWNNPEKKGYAGVSVFSKLKPLSVAKSFVKKDFNDEGRVIILEYNDFVLINVYFPNGRMSPDRLRYKLEFCERLLRFLKGMKKGNIIVCGDFNTAHKEIDLARPKQNEMFSGFLREEREWVDRFIACGFTDTFRHFTALGGNYTWWDYKSGARDRNVGWRIDYIFVSKGLIPRLRKAVISSDVYGSDHCPVWIELGAV